MATTKFTVSTTNNSEQVKECLKDAIEKALVLCGEEAKGYAKKLCPVDTGNLRNSIDYDVLDDTMQVGTNVEYASFVELGTSRQKAQPYLKPAIADHASKYQTMIKEELGG